MPRILIITLMLLVLISSIGATDIMIKRDRTLMRAGAGSFHPVVSEIAINAQVELISKEGSWLKVRYQSQTGYISESATTATKQRNDVFTSIAKTAPSQANVSRHSISAGVKGFGERFSSQIKGNTSFLDTALEDKLNAWFYNDFKKYTYLEAKAEDYRKAYKTLPSPHPDFYTEAQEGFGLAVASAIANLGIYKSQEAKDYVSYVGNIIVEASDVPDIPFRFFILDIPQPNAYACPGGYIFITRGMLKSLANEAELAFVLAHEIAHISRFHGIIEASQRKNQIAAESVFAELDEDTQDSFSTEGKATEAELEEEIYKMFEYLIEGRLDKYEEEADTVALLYVARSGYDPKAALSLLQRLQSSSTQSNNQHYRSESIRERITWVSAQSKKYNTKKPKPFTHQIRFEKYMRYF